MNNISKNTKLADRKPRITKPKAAPTTRPLQLRKLLERKSGATIAQIQNAFDWQPHSARAALSGLRKSGALIERGITARGAVYRIDPKTAVIATQ